MSTLPEEMSTADPLYSDAQASLSGSSTSISMDCTSSQDSTWKPDAAGMPVLECLARGICPPISSSMIQAAKAAAKISKKHSTSALRQAMAQSVSQMPENKLFRY